jgi:preprotein translocase subunit YajC
MLRSVLIASLLLPGVALAQETAAPGAAPMGGSPMASLLPLVLIFFVFYFLLIKPQQRRMKEHQAMLGALKKGDEVVTGGGIVGRITKVGADDMLTVKIAEGVEVSVLKSTVASLSGASKPVPAAKKDPKVKNDNVVPSRESIANDN